MIIQDKKQPHNNKRNRKISIFFIRGFKIKPHLVDKEHKEIEERFGRAAVEEFGNGYMYRKHFEFNRLKQDAIDLFNKQLRTKEPIQVSMEDYVNGYRSMPLTIMRAFSDMRDRRIMNSYPKGGVVIELYDRCYRKPSKGILLPIEEQDEQEGVIAYTLKEWNRVKTKTYKKNLNKHIGKKKYEVAGRINLIID